MCLFVAADKSLFSMSNSDVLMSFEQTAMRRAGSKESSSSSSPDFGTM